MLLLVGIFLKGWMVAVWIMMLAGIVGGKVMLCGARAPRLFYLLALGFLVASLLLMAAPLAVPIVKPSQPILLLGYIGLPLVLMVMALLPPGRETDDGREVVDFVYSLFVFLLLAVLMLGTLAAMLLLDSGYVEALLQTLMVTGGDAAETRALLVDFLTSTGDDLAQLEADRGAGDLQAMTRQAHKIKGAARLVGALELADAATLLETAGRSGDWASVLPLAVDVATAVARLRLHVAERWPG